MHIFAAKETKKLFISSIILFLCCMLVGQGIVFMISNDFKKELITHDYEVAGSLYINNFEKSQIAKSFTSIKSKEDLETGQVLLQSYGYRKSVRNHLIPEVKHFQRKYSILVLLLSVVFSLAFFGTLFFFVKKQDTKMEQASVKVSKFMDGDYEIRLNDNEEGNVSKLFSKINTMATSLTAHIEKEKKNKEFLKDTISDISHQLKTPLAALEMYNEIIRDEKSGNEVVERFTLRSMDELKRMENLIQNLLKLAQLDAGTLELQKNNYSIKPFLKSVISPFHTRIETEKKTILLQCEDNIQLHFDQVWLKEAVSNIIKNALDHTKAQDEIRITCEESPLLITMTIKDNGVGIHPEDIHYVFKRFYRSQFSKDKQGIGIGLSLSKAIIEKHGGSIAVESQWGVGTAFLISFPKLTNL